MKTNRHALKRILSVLLTAAMLFGVLSVSLTVSAATVNERENNDNYATANTLTPGDSVDGVLSTAKDVDYYKLTTNANGKLQINFLHRYADVDRGWTVTLYRYADGSYQQLSEWDINNRSNENISLPFIGAVKDGVYYIKVSNYWTGGVGRSYTVKTAFTATNYAEKEVNNDYYSATKISADKTYHGILNANNDVDYYKFTAPAAGKWQVNFCHTYADADRGWTVTFYRYHDGAYSELTNWDINNRSNEKIALPYIGVVKNGIYFVKVSNYWTGGTNRLYKLKTAFTASAYYEKEPNYVYASATNVVLNNTYGGILNSSSDYDYYKIAVPISGKLTIDFKHKYNDSTHGWNVEVIRYEDGAYTGLCSQTIRNCDNKSINIFCQSVKKGIYYVKISNYWNNDGKPYQLSFSLPIAGLSKLTAASSTKAVKLSWNKVKIAGAYQVQQKVSGKWKTKASVKVTTYTVKSLKAGTTYSFRVRAYKKISGVTYYSGWKYITIATMPVKPAIVNPTTDAKHRIKVKWKPVSAGSGYYVQVSKYKNFSKSVITRRVSGKTSKYCMVNNLKKGVRYYVRVRAYKNYGSQKSLSAWSAVKTIVCK